MDSRKQIFATRGKGVKTERYADRTTQRAYGELAATNANSIAYQKKGAYAGTLIDPFHVQDVRIPDLACYPTGTFQVETEFLWAPTVGTNNDSTAITIYWSGNPSWVYTQGNSGLAPGSVTNAQTNNYLSTTTPTNFSAVRLVSAGVLVKFAGNDTNTAGMITAVQNAGQHSGPVLQYPDNVFFANAVVTAQATKRSVFYAGPSREGCIATYRPLDSTSFSMSLVSNTVGSNRCYGVTTIALHGITAGAQFTVQLVANLEGLVSDNTTGFEQGQVCMDSAAFEHGLQAASQVSGVLPGDNETCAQIQALGNALASSSTVSKKRKM